MEFFCQLSASVERLVNSAIVVMQKVKGDHVEVIRRFLAEGICKSIEAPNQRTAHVADQRKQCGHFRL
jgi:hypothetical protein